MVSSIPMDMSIEPKITSLDVTTVVSTGRALVKQNGKWGLIDKTGRYLSEPQWENNGEPDFYDGIARVKRNGKWGLHRPKRVEW